MNRFSKEFLLGAATSAHQVEGNNVNSDSWVLEHLPHTIYAEPSDMAVDHYHHYEEDIKMLAQNGLNAFRFTMEWARLEPRQGEWDEEEEEHYRRVLQCCQDNSITPIVTMHHFSSPKWLISLGGWENPHTADLFAEYCRQAVMRLGDKMVYVNTINEANMGLQFAKIMKAHMKGQNDPKGKKTEDNGVQIGVQGKEVDMMAYMMEAGAAFGCNPGQINTFLSPRSEKGDGIIMDAHQKARDAMKSVCPHLKVGISLSLHDIQAMPGGEKLAGEEWKEEFTHYLPAIENDDFLGVQSYTRKIFGPDGVLPPAPDAPRTQNAYEDYPMAVAHVVCKVAEDFRGDILITENGIGTDDDARRMEFIRDAVDGVAACVADGIPVKGYLYWSLLDNFEWMAGYSSTFGLVAVDRTTQERKPKESLAFLGTMR